MRASIHNPFARCVVFVRHLCENHVALTTYVFRQEVGRSIVVFVQSHVARLISQRSPASEMAILSTDGVGDCHTDSRFRVALVVDVYVHDILAGSLVEK